VENSWIEQLMIAIDIIQPIAEIAQICHQSLVNMKKTIFLNAPAIEGLYLIWCRGDLMYNMRDAVNNHPKNYDNCDRWYQGFLAWLRVERQVKSNPSGDMVWFIK
jgi:hypothetical protein